MEKQDKKTNVKMKKKRTIFAHGLPYKVTDEEVKHYFSSFGPVLSVKIIGKKNNCALIQFGCGIDHILEASHEIRGRAFQVKKSMDYWEQINDPVCETKHVMAAIQHSHDVRAQVEHLDKVISLTEKDLQNRYEVAARLQKKLSSYFPKCQVHIFGSTANGFGYEGCDVDLLFEPSPMYFDRVSPDQDDDVEAPSVRAVEEGYVKHEELCNLSRKNVLLFVTAVLKKCEFIAHALFISARVPIVKLSLRVLMYNQYKVSCDLSCSSRLPLCNTRLLKFYSELDSRVQILGKVLKYWAKSRKIIYKGSLSSYCFILLVIYFLQRCDPPVLPSVRELMERSNESRIINGYETAFCNDLSCFAPSSNKKPVEILLQEFFQFYANFDFGLNVICPLEGEFCPRSCFQDLPGDSNFKTALVCVQDPFEIARNVSVGLKANNFIIFCNEVSNAAQNFDPQMNPEDELPWGLQELFIHVKENVRVGKLTFDTNLEGHICGFVLDFENKFVRSIGTKNRKTFWYHTLTAAMLYLFNHALLFDAVVTDRISSSDGTLVKDSIKNLYSIVRIEVAVLFNTWAERKKFKHLLKETDFYLDSEHDISFQLAQEHKPLPEFGSFVCHCYFFSTECEESRMGLCFSCTDKHWNCKDMLEFLRTFIPSSLKKMFSGVPKTVATFVRENA